MDDMTYLQAAKALGITKNALKYRIKKVAPECVYKDPDDGLLRITPEGFERLQSMEPPRRDAGPGSGPVADADEPPRPEPTRAESGDGQIVASLTRALDALTAQLKAKDEQIAQLMTLVQQSHSLHAREQEIAQAKNLAPPVIQTEEDVYEPPTAKKKGKKKKGKE